MVDVHIFQLTECFEMVRSFVFGVLMNSLIAVFVATTVVIVIGSFVDSRFRRFVACSSLVTFYCIITFDMIIIFYALLSNNSIWTRLHWQFPPLASHQS